MAAVRLLPGAGVGLQASDGGHPGGAALRHRGVSGPRDWYMCQQHRTLPTTVQQDGGVSERSIVPFQHNNRAQVHVKKPEGSVSISSNLNTMSYD